MKMSEQIRERIERIAHQFGGTLDVDAFLIPALEAYAEEEQKDAKRMDWLEANLSRLEGCTWRNHNLGRVVSFGEEATLGECRQTLRQAIDKAMNPPGG